LSKANDFAVITVLKISGSAHSYTATSAYSLLSSQLKVKLRRWNERTHWTSSA